ncbi:TlpA family protein disulfide reductase [Ruminococcaceae bacterium OttesenSCG-928-A11]|nr:TlpA family protein disulfide reductase [Ruminococcaceae bacterium OttesenSCG-928-A11]
MNKKLIALLIAGALSLSILTACGNGQTTEPEAESIEDGVALTEDQLKEMFGETEYRAADFNMKRSERYRFPFLGMEFSLPEAVMHQMDNEEIAMLTTEDRTQEGEIKYAFVSWNHMTEEQRNAMVSSIGTEHMDWENSLERVATLGMFEKSNEAKLGEITGCTKHQLLGESDDGLYSYYLSSNPGVDDTFINELSTINLGLIDKAPTQDISAFDEPYDEFSDTTIGEFVTEDINGSSYTHESLSEHELTLINVFTTWCSPCVQEIPELEELSKNMQDKGVGIIGVVMDATTTEGLEKAKALAQRTGATYPFIIPDAGNMNGKLNSIMSFPTVEGLAESALMDVKMLQRMRNDAAYPKNIESVIALCIGMHLQPELSEELIKRSGFSLRMAQNEVHLLYHFFIGSYYKHTVAECNELLTAKGFDVLTGTC